MAGRWAYPRPAFFAFAFPAPEGFERATLSPPDARWDTELREFLLDWDDARAAPDPHRATLDFGQSAIRHACDVCGWDPSRGQRPGRLAAPHLNRSAVRPAGRCSPHACRHREATARSLSAFGNLRFELPAY